MSNGEIRVSITEIPKIREALEKADKEIERLNNIIKEVREYIEKYTDNTNFLEVPSKELLEILDKENKK